MTVDPLGYSHYGLLCWLFDWCIRLLIVLCCSTAHLTFGLSVSRPHTSAMEPASLKNAIIRHFASMVTTQETQNDLPVCWSAGKWNAQYWAATSMEDGITQLFDDLGLGAQLTAMQRAGLNAYPGEQRINAFWLPVWKFRLDRDAKNGRLTLSPFATLAS